MKGAKKKVATKNEAKYAERFTIPGTTFTGLVSTLLKGADKKVKLRGKN